VARTSWSSHTAFSPWNGFEELVRFVLSHEGQQVMLDHARYLPRRAQQVQDAGALLAR
jgi:phosphate transport system substrate-binding protein